MKELINDEWAPSIKTINTLMSEKYGYTRRKDNVEGQIERLWKDFVSRYDGQSFDNASSKFFDFVVKSERGRNAPGKPDIEKQQEELQARMPEDPVKGEVKSTKLSREDAISWYLANGKPTVEL